MVNSMNIKDYISLLFVFILQVYLISNKQDNFHPVVCTGTISNHFYSQEKREFHFIIIENLLMNYWLKSNIPNNCDFWESTLAEEDRFGEFIRNKLYMKEYFVLYEGISDRIFLECGQFFSSEISLHLINIFPGLKGKSLNLLGSDSPCEPVMSARKARDRLQALPWSWCDLRSDSQFSMWINNFSKCSSERRNSKKKSNLPFSDSINFTLIPIINYN